MSSDQSKKKGFSFLQNQCGVSLVELLISSSILGLLILGLFQFLFNINRNVVDTTEQFNSIQWNKEIIETLLKEPDCLSSLCTSITSSCTNLLSDFEDQVGTTVNYTALYSTSSNLITPSKLYVNASDPDYDVTKHNYKGLAIDQIVVTAGDDNRDNRLTLRVSFKKSVNSESVLLVQPLNLRVVVDEYQSDLIEDSGYSKVKTCHIMGILHKQKIGACYIVDQIDDTEGSFTTEKGRTLIGCNEGFHSSTSRITAFGYAAGQKNTTGVANTFIGYKSGENNTTESENTFVGNQTGFSITETSDSSIESGHTYIGSRAGESSTTNYHNTFVGNAAGIDTTTGVRNTFIGASAGRLHTEGDDNVMIGPAAGYSSKNSNSNVLIGNRSTLEGNMSTGEQNTYVGYDVGRGWPSRGFSSPNQNTYLGYKTGYKKYKGISNTGALSIGYQAGYNDSLGYGSVLIGSCSACTKLKSWNEYPNSNSYSVIVGSRAAEYANKEPMRNVFIGSKAGYNNAANSNTFIGYQSGYNTTTGQLNIFIGSEDGGAQAGGIIKTSEKTLNIGNLILGKMPNSIPSVVINKVSDLSSSGGMIIYGDLIVEGDLYYKNKVFQDGTEVTIPDSTPDSSRVYKKNIQPFIDYASALKDIKFTSLFYYEYKHDHPDKKRMGVISEELPEHLQIRDKGVPSKPDWVSIYGTLWAGIKALSLKLSLLKAECFQLVKKTGMELIQQWESQQMVFRKQFAELKTSLSQWREEWSKEWNEKWRVYELRTSERFQQSQSEVQILKQKLEKKRKTLKNSDEMISELHHTLTELKEIKKELAITQNLIQGTQDRLHSNHERLTRIEGLIQ